MERASQKTKRSQGSSGTTNMGNFAKMERIEVREEDLDLEKHDWLVGGGDDDVVNDRKAAASAAASDNGGKRLRLVQRYDSGQSCWNGPRRSTTVVLACAEKDELWRVVEEEKCVYRMEVGTAAACDDNDGDEVGNKDSAGSSRAEVKKEGKKMGKSDGEKEEL